MAQGQALSDETARYVEAAAPPFEAMRAAATRLAGLLLQREVDPRARLAQAPALERLGDVLEEAEGLLLAIHPRGPGAAHHLRHLTGALTALQRALADAYRAEQGSACERHLNDAIAQLRHAANALPGFTLVDLADCCGAAHAQGAPCAD